MLKGAFEVQCHVTKFERLLFFFFFLVNSRKDLLNVDLYAHSPYLTAVYETYPTLVG